MVHARSEPVDHPERWGDLADGGPLAPGTESTRRELGSVVNLSSVLGEATDAESRAELQARIELLEDKFDRLARHRDRVDQAVESQVEILRTTLESALSALDSGYRPTSRAALTDMPRLRIPSLDELLPDHAHSRSGEDEPALTTEELSEELNEKVLQARSDLRYEIHQVALLIERHTARAEELADLRRELLERIAESEGRAEQADAFLEEILSSQQGRLERERQDRLDAFARLSREFPFLAGSLTAADR